MAVALKAKNHCHVYAEKKVTEFEWSLADWSLLRDSYKNGFESPKFMVGEDTNCHLIISYVPYSNYSNYSNSSYISMILNQLNFCSIKMSVSFIGEQKETLRSNTTFFHRNLNDQDFVLEFNHRNFGIEHYVRNDTLTLLCEITTVKSLIKSDISTDITNVGVSVDTSEKFKEMYHSKEFYDITFLIGGKKLNAHKFVLAANSSVFKAMFATDMIERRQGVIDIKDAEFALFDIFLKYMYTGEIHKIEEVVEDLVIVADKYQVMDLKNLCVQFMLRTVNKKTASKYMSIADKISCKELQKKVASMSIS